VTATLSTEWVQPTETPVVEALSTLRLVGAVGGVVSAATGQVAVEALVVTTGDLPAVVYESIPRR
jgi:hypothetical protein